MEACTGISIPPTAMVDPAGGVLRGPCKHTASDLSWATSSPSRRVRATTWAAPAVAGPSRSYRRRNKSHRLPASLPRAAQHQVVLRHPSPAPLAYSRLVPDESLRQILADSTRTSQVLRDTLENECVQNTVPRKGVERISDVQGHRQHHLAAGDASSARIPTRAIASTVDLFRWNPNWNSLKSGPVSSKFQTSRRATTCSKSFEISTSSTNAEGESARRQFFFKRISFPILKLLGNQPKTRVEKCSHTRLQRPHHQCIQTAGDAVGATSGILSLHTTYRRTQQALGHGQSILIRDIRQSGARSLHRIQPASVLPAFWSRRLHATARSQPIPSTQIAARVEGNTGNPSVETTALLHTTVTMYVTDFLKNKFEK